MIKIEMSIKSLTLLRPVRVSVFLPYGFTSCPTPYRTVWLLHAAMSDGGMFVEYAPLLDFANKEGYALIAPSLGNGYYADTGYERQASFLMDELLPIMRQTISLSHNREDNTVLGVSMGGYGAVRWAMDAPETFRAVAAISGWFGMPCPVDERIKKDRELRPIYQIFVKEVMPKLLMDKSGNLHPQADILKLMGKKEPSVPFPRIGLFCGENDYLSLGQNKMFFESCEDCGVPAELFLTHGSHNADYWNPAMLRAVQWLG